MMPPRLARWLIERRFAPDAAESIIGDLNEEFATRQTRDGRGRARWWFWRQAVTSLAARHRAADDRKTVKGDVLNLSWVQDIRIGLRGFRRAPGFAAAAILMLALGVGMSTAIGTAASRTLIRPLPYAAGERLIVAGDGNSTDGVSNVGFETALDWRARVKSFDELAIIRQFLPTLQTEDGAEQLSGLRVSANFFSVLGVRPALGANFSAEDDTPDRRYVVMLSDGLWRRRFGASPTIVGSTIQLGGRPFRVAGVLPASFEPLISERYYQRAEIWSLLGYAVGGDSSCRSCRHLRAIARLAPGISVAQARAELAGVHAVLRQEHPADYEAAPPQIATLHDEVVASMRRPLQVLSGAVLFVLLVACANVAGLLMARATDRAREIALRAALGATRGRLLRQLLTESLILAVTGSAAGVIVARVTLRVLADQAPVTIPRLGDAAADPWLLGIACAASLGALMLFAVLPALATSRTDIESTLREGRHTGTPRALRMREWLMMIEVAAALLVVAGGGLMYRTVDALLQVDPGFRPAGVLTANLSLVGQRWAEDDAVRAFQTDLLTRVSALPGVTGAALAGQIPLGNNYDTRGFHILGRPSVSEADDVSVERYSVTPDYFRVMGIPLRAGRLITAADTFTSEKVMVISETTARTVWPGESPLGRQVRIGSERHPHISTVVGIVGDVRHYRLDAAPTPQFYMPQSQFTDSGLVLVAAGSNPAALAAPIRREVARLGSDVPFYGVATLEDLVSGSVADRTFLMRLLAGMALITLVLAGLGLYGVMAESVAGRRRELGIRVALGASRASLLSLVASRGLRLVAVGALAGTIAAVAAGYLIRSQLFGVAPVDPLTLLSALAAIALVAAAAHVAPMRRALGADPKETLRQD